MGLNGEDDEWFVELIMNLDEAVLKYFKSKEPKNKS